MFHGFKLLELSSEWLVVAGSLFVTAVFLLTFPLRGGHGQHAGSGPGALTVWALRESLKPRSPHFHEIAELFRLMSLEPKPVGPARVREKLEPPPYVGAHRSQVEDLVELIHPRVEVYLDPAALRPH